MKPVLLDTGVVVALLDRSEQHHGRCAAALQDLHLPPVTCEAVIAEACYLLRGIPGAPEAVIANVAAGIFQIQFELSHCAPDIQRLLRKYRDQRIDFADACLIQMAAELRTGEILTLDRDFELYRWGGNRPFRLLVPLD